LVGKPLMFWDLMDKINWELCTSAAFTDFQNKKSK